MTRRTAHLVVLGLVGLSFALPACLYARLPDPMPTHFGLDGAANGWMPRPLGAFLLPALGLGAWGLLAAIGAAIPRGDGDDERARDAYARIVVVVMALPCAIEGLTLAAALSLPVDVGRVTMALVGLVTAGVGASFAGVPPNGFVGVRTPWTRASPEVWARTHRLAARTFVGGGLACAAWALVAPWPPLGLVALVPATIVPVVYSRRLAHDLGARGDGDGDRT